MYALAYVVFGFLGMILHWMPYGLHYVAGTQGRYFIPLFPLSFILIMSKVFMCKKKIGSVLLGITIFMQCVILA